MSTGKRDRSEGDLNQTDARRRWMADCLGGEAKRLLKEDETYFLRQSLSTPCLDVLESCHGSRISSIEGRSYLDFHGNSVHQVGYGHPKVVEAVKRQLDQLPFCPRRYTNMPAIELASRLAQLTPGDLGKSLFCPGGATAVGMALKLARVVTGRFKTVSWWDSFHGASLDTISVGGEAHFRRGMGPLLPGAIHVPPPSEEGETEADWLQSAEYVDYVMEHEGDVAAFVAEPVRTTAVLIPPKEYWIQIKEICQNHKALLIFDEIPLCLGRTGRLFACEHTGVVPDVLCIGKGLGGGVFPLAAIVARNGLDLASHTSLGHYTHEKTPLGCAAALATLDVIREEMLLDRAMRMEERARSRLRTLRSRHPIIESTTALGMLWGIRLVRTDGSPALAESELLMYRCLEEGLSFKVSMGNTLVLMPPLTLTDDQFEESMGILDAALNDLTG